VPIPDSRTVFSLQVPAELEVPAAMREAVAEVLAGEYESGYFGERLRILDLGANVGSFSLWAHLRWPGSQIQAFEPHPGTFAILQRNLNRYDNITLHNTAIYPSPQTTLPFFTRYDGDGESGLADCMAATFVAPTASLQVNVLHPSRVPAADVVKLDVEGAEADILAHLPLEETSLVLLEYQNDRNRHLIKQLLETDFRLEYEDEFAWDDLLDEPGYRPELAGNHWGRMFFARRRQCRLRTMVDPHFQGRLSDPAEPEPVANGMTPKGSANAAGADFDRPVGSPAATPPTTWWQNVRQRLRARRSRF
jgi:FkbM family methyltransferase